MDDLKRLTEAIASQVPPEDLSVLQTGNSHDYSCRCDTCRKWWKLVGPDDGVEGNYGPFTQAEIEAA